MTCCECASLYRACISYLALFYISIRDSVQDELTFKGVVFNEMKGVYSSPDSMNSRATQHALFPNNTYADDSGGDPAAIPDLTFEE